MNFDAFDRSPDNSDEEPYFGSTSSRAEIVRSVLNRTIWDVVIVGGGIHGAALAHLAALNGLHTLLLEREDYAFGTSSRSSKMAHGGLRYLEMLDFRQVLEGIRAREALFEYAPHLVRPHRFFIPVRTREWWFRWKLGLGLTIYDLFVRHAERRHRFVHEGDPELHDLLQAMPGFSAGYLYTDGIMDDSRLVLDTVLAARQEGAVCLNHASFDRYSPEHGRTVRFGWTDRVNNESYEALAGVVVNCTGPWVPHAGGARQPDLASRVRYSRGAHLLFDHPWKGPALFLPMEGRARYYFVWPHFAGTMIGTTEREIPEPELDPLPSRDEVDEILGRVSKDLPESGLSRSHCHYGFAGTRVLPLRNPSRSVARMSRRHDWVYAEGMLSLLGGKFTTAAWTAFEGLQKIFELADLRRTPVPVTDRLLPGAALFEESVRTFRNKAEGRVSEDSIRAAIRRFGSRVRFLTDDERALHEIAPGLLRGEVEMALRVEQVETLEDLLRRRLGVEYEAGHGFEALPALVKLLDELEPGRDWEGQVKDYCGRLEQVRSVIHDR